MKKICAVLLCAMMVFACFSAAAEEPFKINVKAQNVTDDGFDVYLSLENNPGIVAAQLVVDFDFDYLQVTGSGKTGIFSNEQVFTSADEGSEAKLEKLTSVNVTWYKLSNVTDNGNIVKISFKYKKDTEEKNAKISVRNIKGNKTSSSVINLDGETVEFETQDITVKVPKKKSSGSSGSSGGGSTVVKETKKAVKKTNIEKIKYMKFKDDEFEPERPATRYEVIEALDFLFDVDSKTLDKAYSDVDKEHENAVRKFVTAGVLNGYEDKTFKGENTITRAELVKVLTIAFEIEEDLKATSDFTDISGHWAEKYIKAFVSRKYIFGYEDNTFRPDNNITRAELVALINRMTGNSSDPAKFVFKDVSEDHWAYNEIIKAVKQ